MERIFSKTIVNSKHTIFQCLLMFLFICMPASISAQLVDDWEIKIENYNGNEYIIKYSEYTYCIQNKNYVFNNLTCDIELEGETQEEWEERRYATRLFVYNVASEVFDFESIPIGDLDFSIFHIICYFDSNTKNYVGAKFLYDIEVKDYFTIDKLYLLEQKLSQARINTGITNLLNPEKDYFTIRVGIYLGTQ